MKFVNEIFRKLIIIVPEKSFSLYEKRDFDKNDSLSSHLKRFEILFYHRNGLIDSKRFYKMVYKFCRHINLISEESSTFLKKDLLISGINLLYYLLLTMRIKMYQHNSRDVETGGL